LESANFAAREANLLSKMSQIACLSRPGLGGMSCVRAKAC
jgi:hypothetical protein